MKALVSLNSEAFIVHDHSGVVVLHHINSGKDLHPSHFLPELQPKVQEAINFFQKRAEEARNQN